MKRRGNGLDADSFAPLIDLAPHLADTMLEALREAGVAAYVTPTPDPGEHGRRTPGTGSDGDSLDRLYVDTAMQSAAEGILHTQLTRLRSAEADLPDDLDSGDLKELDPADLPGGHPSRAEPRTGEPGGSTTAERDEDAIWAEIVAGFDSAPADGDTPWPDQENIDPPTSAGEDRAGLLPTARLIKPAGEDEPQPQPADEEEHFVPPPPPPLPSTDPVTKAAWAALVGGPLYLLITVIAGWEVPGWAAFLSVAAFIGGFVTLVLRMGDDPRDTDDGAVV